MDSDTHRITSINSNIESQGVSAISGACSGNFL